jgi:hypothetical protein
MIIVFFINVIVVVLSVVFGWLPDVHTLPQIMGYDIDTALVNGMGQINTIMASVWVLKYLVGGFLFIMGYHLIKMVLKFILGSRSPHHS